MNDDRQLFGDHVEELFGAAFDELAAVGDEAAEARVRLLGFNGAAMLALDFVSQPEVLGLFFSHCLANGLGDGMSRDRFTVMIGEAIEHLMSEQQTLIAVGEMVDARQPRPPG